MSGEPGDVTAPIMDVDSTLKRIHRADSEAVIPPGTGAALVYEVTSPP